VLSWRPAGASEQLYLSPRSEYAAGKAIRGGVPVCFPQFAERGPLPKHGFARTLPWELVSQEQGKDDALAVMRLRDNDVTRKLWPHAFELELSVRVGGRGLDVELACENLGQASDGPLQFTAALHTYLRVADLDAVSVEGLAGLRYFDSIKQAEALQRMDLLLTGEKGVLDLDRIYFGVKERPLLVTEDRRAPAGLRGRRGLEPRAGALRQAGGHAARWLVRDAVRGGRLRRPPGRAAGRRELGRAPEPGAAVAPTGRGGRPAAARPAAR
jgi:glucose-6-phosphate 1-epimerase